MRTRTLINVLLLSMSREIFKECVNNSLAEGKWVRQQCVQQM